MNPLPLITILSLALAIFAGPHGHPGGIHRHRKIAENISHRAGNNSLPVKQYKNARCTFYDVGEGACGQHNIATDFIVALNSAQFGSGYPGPHCLDDIILSCNGKTAKAKIMDECPSCPFGGLDLSRGLFDFFASEALGVLNCEWYFANEDRAPVPQSPSTHFKPPSPTPPAPVLHPHTNNIPAPHSSKVLPTTKVSSSSDSSGQSALWVHTPSLSSSLAMPTAVSTPTTASSQSRPEGLLASLDEIIVSFAKFVLACQDHSS